MPIELEFTGSSVFISGLVTVLTVMDLCIDDAVAPDCRFCVQHPIVASAAGVMFLLGRVLYFRGYSTGSPDNRLNGGPVFIPAFLCLLVICTKAGVKLISSKLATQ
jgi:hypothetical protein